MTDGRLSTSECIQVVASRMGGESLHSHFDLSGPPWQVANNLAHIRGLAENRAPAGQGVDVTLEHVMAELADMGCTEAEVEEQRAALIENCPRFGPCPRCGGSACAVPEPGATS